MERSAAYEKIMKECTLCPRNCRVDRLAGQTGYCGQTAQIRAARAALHYWEEPCICGPEGSGAVFFSGCVLKCVFCQNGQIARGKVGWEIETCRLAEIFLELQEQGANNINLVTPTQYVPQIAGALEAAKAKGLRIPIVYNTGSYEKVETLKWMEGLVDIYLPDLKYYSSELAARYSNAPDYFETAAAAIEEMVRQVGEPVMEGQEEEARMKRGVIVRHLLMPGCLEDSKAVIRYLHQTYGNRIYLSIMNQYTPVADLEKYPELNRKVSRRSYEKLVNYALALGVENGFIQEGDTAKESFIPGFDGEGLQKQANPHHHLTEEGRK